MNHNVSCFVDRMFFIQHSFSDIIDQNVKCRGIVPEQSILAPAAMPMPPTMFTMPSHRFVGVIFVFFHKIVDIYIFWRHSI
jgi:hypothetical protein